MTDFHARIEQYLRDTGTAASTLGREALGDPNFVFQVRNGRDPRLSVARKVLDYIDARKSQISSEVS